MHISVALPQVNRTANHGFGVAGLGMIESLRSLGYTVNYNDPAAPVEIAFGHPTTWEWSGTDAYRIGYAAWESTRLPDSWIDPMLAVDEIWADSPWVARVFDKHGFGDVQVYQHGIDTFTWFKKRRQYTGKIKFLHIGEPAARKGGQMVFDSFCELFAGRKDVSLTIKADQTHNLRGFDRFYFADDGTLTLNEADAPDHVNLITDRLSTEGLRDLVHDHDVLLYPSWGEGFGFIPLQAMATGMPVVCTGAWAAFEDLILPELVLPSKLVQSPWPDIHPGGMYQPSKPALAGLMLELADPATFMDYSIRAYARSFQVEREYDWNTLTATAFDGLQERISLSV